MSGHSAQDAIAEYLSAMFVDGEADAFVETKLIRRVKPNVSSSEADSVDDGPSLAGSTAKQPAPEK
ncbi:MAG: hypothetical protein ACI9Y1_002924, partial [Lentisphaeria bacterium]